MKIAYKGTDENMCCRDTKYYLGQEYYISKDKYLMGTKISEGLTPIKSTSMKFNMCSNKAIHYCVELEQCFTWYKPENSRFFKVEILGNYYEDNSKGCTNRLRFIEEISREEIEEVIKSKENKKLDSKLRLPDVRELQKKFPGLILGGSVGLFLQGIELSRIKNYGVGDLDFTSPYFVNLEELDKISMISERSSGNSFDYNFVHQDNNYVIDLAINPQMRYIIVNYEGNDYKVVPYNIIISYKCGYVNAVAGNKHHEDLKELLVNRKDNNSTLPF